jgi:hypothetical protein
MQPQKPAGKPLDLDASELDTAAIVSGVDVQFARVVWQQHAPPAMHDLLDAAPMPDEADKGGT